MPLALFVVVVVVLSLFVVLEFWRFSGLGFRFGVIWVLLLSLMHLWVDLFISR